jgi:Protein of unknown function (DUF3052)
MNNTLTPLWQQLEINNDTFAAVINPPENYFEMLGGNISQHRNLPSLNAGRFDLIHVFITDASSLKDQIMESLFSLTPWGIIWVSWKTDSPKTTNSVNQDLIKKTAKVLGLSAEFTLTIHDGWNTIKLIPKTS